MLNIIFKVNKGNALPSFCIVTQSLKNIIFLLSAKPKKPQFFYGLVIVWHWQEQFTKVLLAQQIILAGFGCILLTMVNPQ